jgi:hypothetical protein
VRHTTIRCDRCSTPISGGHSIVEVKAGDLVKQLDQPIDLCSTFSGQFLDFLKPEPFKLGAVADGVRGDLGTLGRAIGDKTTI